MPCTRLRIDPNDGAPVVEYRIENGGVERRTVATPTGDGIASEERWEQLTPTQIASHIIANTAVAYWLYRRMGAQSLFEICGQHPAFVADEEVDVHRNPQVVKGEFGLLGDIPAK